MIDAPPVLSATPVDLRNPLFVSNPQQAYEALRARKALSIGTRWAFGSWSATRIARR